ncbi:MAG: hypothetical protein HOP19_13030 [Acidobacteria bacterium]|nr:hypothetical protein [Acidobacteriota bacterium]
MEKHFRQFYARLALRAVANDNALHLLNAAERAALLKHQRRLMCVAALLSVCGFLAYYLPTYWWPAWFPSVALNLRGFAFRLPWAESLWCIGLSVIEIYLLTLLNLTGAHAVAAATGFHQTNRHADTLIPIGLEAKNAAVKQFGIDPFQGLNRWLLFAFNFVLRLKGWLANTAVRFATRLLLGRYAPRVLLDFIGMPIYMALNAWSVYAVMRQARVVVMGEALIAELIKSLPARALSANEQELLYDTLQFIAVSKRDFHPNHYLLTRELLRHFAITPREEHPLPPDYLPRLRASSKSIQALCRLIILLGFMLDGHFSWRERSRLRALQAAGIFTESTEAVAQYTKDFLNGAGIAAWSAPYLQTYQQP